MFQSFGISKDKNHENLLEKDFSLAHIDYLSDEDKAYFDKVLKCLDTLGVEYVIEQKLVRGLDYYNHTVFEFIYDDINCFK